MIAEVITEKRSAVRHVFCRDLQIVYEGYGRDIALRTPDISPQGMFINTVQEFPLGAVLYVRFRLRNSGIRVHTKAEVRYCLSGVGIGVEFTEMTDSARRAIEEETCGGSDW
jgi:hypothetical protein